MANGSGLKRPHVSSESDASPRPPVARRLRGPPIRPRGDVPRTRMVLRSQARRLRRNAFPPVQGFGRGRGLRNFVHGGHRTGLRRRIVGNQNNIIQAFNSAMVRGVSRRGRIRRTSTVRGGRIVRPNSIATGRRAPSVLNRGHNRGRSRRAGRGYRNSAANRNHQSRPSMNESNGGGIQPANQSVHCDESGAAALGLLNDTERSSVENPTKRDTAAVDTNLVNSKNRTEASTSKPKAVSSNETKRTTNDSSGTAADTSNIVDDGELPSTSNGRSNAEQASMNRDFTMEGLLRGKVEVLPLHPPPNVPMQFMDSYSLPAEAIPMILAGIRHFRISRMMRGERQQLRLRMQSRGRATTPQDVIATGDGNHNDPMVTITVVPCEDLIQQYNDENEAEDIDDAGVDEHEADANDGEGDSSDGVSHISDDTLFMLNNGNEDGYSEYTIHSGDFWPIFDMQPIYGEGNNPEQSDAEYNVHDDDDE